MFTATQKLIRILIVIILGGFTCFFLYLAWFVFGVHVQSRHIEPEVALWMEHAWARGTEKDFMLLNQQIEDSNISTLYFHVGPLGNDGEIPDDVDIFTPGLESLPTMNYAWIGQVRNKILLEDPATRDGILKTVGWLLDQGFDGIHVDIEPVTPDDEDFMLFIQMLNADYPDTPISVAMDEWQPHGTSKLISWIFKEDIQSYWTSRQVKRIAPWVDQLVVMTYDTKFHDPKLYTWWVEQQTVAMSKLLGEDTELFIGIPAYEEGQSIDPKAENVETGVAGFLRGISNVRSRLNRITGLAIYADWELDDTEWIIIKSL